MTLIDLGGEASLELVGGAVGYVEGELSVMVDANINDGRWHKIHIQPPHSRELMVGGVTLWGHNNSGCGHIDSGWGHIECSALLNPTLLMDFSYCLCFTCILNLHGNRHPFKPPMKSQRMLHQN